MIFIGEKTKQEINDYLKTRVDSMDFSKDLVQILVDSNIRTIGGIISKNESDIFKIKGMDKNYINQLIGKLSPSFVVKFEGENINFVPRYYEEKIPNNINGSKLSEQDKLDIINEVEGQKNLKRIQNDINLCIKEKLDIFNLKILSLGFSVEIEREIFKKNILTLGGIFQKKDNLDDLILKEISQVLSFFRKKLEDIDVQITELYKDEFKITNKYREINNQNIQVEDTGISSRDIGIFSAFVDGIVLEDIASQNSVSRERVRQIVKKTFEVMDLDYDQERERIQANREELRPKKIKKVKRWAREYDSCIECLTVDFSHSKSGRCQRCDGAFRGKTREAIILAHDNVCDMCDSSRDDSLKIHDRDFYVTKEQDVLCKKCFLETTGKKLGNWKNYEWSRFYSKCKSCDSTKNPHLSKGVCVDCSDFITDKRREDIISGANSECHSCKMTRPESYNIHGRDLYITKDEKVLCRKCHLENTLNSARETHKNKWKMFYKD